MNQDDHSWRYWLKRNGSDYIYLFSLRVIAKKQSFATINVDRRRTDVPSEDDANSVYAICIITTAGWFGRRAAPTSVTVRRRIGFEPQAIENLAEIDLAKFDL